MGSALWFNPFRSSIPGPPMPLFTLRVPPHDDPCKPRGQDGFAFSFPVGLFHPLQHAGLSRRTLKQDSDVETNWLTADPSQNGATNNRIAVARVTLRVVGPGGAEP